MPLNNVFESAPDERGKCREAIRTEVFPKLSDPKYNPLRALKILHRVSTSQIQGPFDKNERKKLHKVVVKEIPGLDFKNRRNLLNSGKTSDISVQGPPSGKGQYREIGSVDQEGQRRKVWMRVGIDYFTREGRTFYVPPTRQIEELMQQLEAFYLYALSESEGSLSQILLTLSCFYGVGNNIIHPFIGGNHRAFDRFFELELNKQGYKLEIPTDEFGNFPIDGKIHNYLALLTYNFINYTGLSLGFTPKYVEEEDAYQEQLVSGIQKMIESGFNESFFLFWYAQVAREYLQWVVNIDGSELNEEIKNSARVELDKMINNCTKELTIIRRSTPRES